MMMRFVRFGVSEEANKNFEKRLRAQQILKNMVPGESLRIGDPKLGKVDIQRPGMDIVEIQKHKPSDSLEEQFYTQLIALPIGKSMSVGDSTLGLVDLEIPDLGQIVEIKKIPSDRGTEEHFDTRISCNYILSRKEINDRNYQQVKFSNLLYSRENLSGTVSSMPGFDLTFGDVFSVILPDHPVKALPAAKENTSFLNRINQK